MVGKPTDIYSLQYRGVQFRDSRKKFGSSLEVVLKEYGIDERYWKYKFDFEKLKTYRVAKNHKDEIMYYVKLDVIGLHKVHEAYDKGFRDMLLNICKQMLNKYYKLEEPGAMTLTNDEMIDNDQMLYTAFENEFKGSHYFRIAGYMNRVLTD